MSYMDIVDLSSDDDTGEVDVKTVKMEPDLVERYIEQKECFKSGVARLESEANCRRQGSEENISSSAPSTGQSGTSVLDQEQSPIDDRSLCSTSPICAAPLCRQFWKAGNYDNGLTPKSILKNGSSYLRIHPKFLHSNATSHKWAFGAIAELLDNAVDEIQNRASFVIVDKTLNPRDGSPSLLIQDDGGGMDPEAIRYCLSFGYSDKKSKSAIGQCTVIMRSLHKFFVSSFHINWLICSLSDGNGFKTSSMRLGADVIVFSRRTENRTLTQSIGLLSYTFLTQSGHDRIVVPVVDYQFNTTTDSWDILRRYAGDHFMSNLSMLLQWSPYSTEAELLKQFDDIEYHGTKIIIYNLWQNDEGNMELDFESDPEDILIDGLAKRVKEANLRMAASEQHIANRLRYSLRAYLSILYLRLPESFCILLRGRVVEYHNIATDLKFPEFVVYKPQSGGCLEGTVVTTIGFLKEAPNVNIHGFNIYHKNRLILPFWRVVGGTNSSGRGVVGVLEANFIEPTHNKQDFEKTSLFQKLEGRLKDMTTEYWRYHCELIGYQVNKKRQAPMPSQVTSDYRLQHGTHQPVVLSRSSPVVDSPAGGTIQHSVAASSNWFVGRPGLSISDTQKSSQHGAHLKRKEHNHLLEPEKVKRKAGIEANGIDTRSNQEIQPATTSANQLEDPKAAILIQENKKLHAQCLEYEKREEELNRKVTKLRSELFVVQNEYVRLLAELKSLEEVKEENNVNM